MKSTILIYKNPDMPESGLRVASREEWTQILKANRGLPRDSRRFFICDSFEDCGIIDRIFIETSRRRIMMDDIREWTIRRGDIFFADFGQTVGSEQSGVRPVLAVQNNVGNRYSPTIIVAPMTSKTKKMEQPTHVEIGEQFGLNESSVILLEQIRTIDRGRIISYVGHADGLTMASVNRALRVSLGLY